MKPVRLAFIVSALFLAGCRQGMYDQAKYEPLEGSPMFADGRSARPLVDGTIPVGGLERDNPALSGKVGNRLAENFPMPVTDDLIRRGRERFDIYCAVCHGYSGYGDGMIVQRGFPAPPSYHDDRLRRAPAGHFVDVITNGFGTMYSYGDRVPPEDRWAIAAYIRALQRSQNATLSDVPAQERARLETEP